MNNGNIIKVDEIKKSVLSKAKSKYETITINKNEIDNYKNAGWEELPNKYKYKTKVRRVKKIEDWFEERIWALFIEMGFERINILKSFKIDYGKNLSKQVDVFAIDNEVALVVECKACNNLVKKSYQKDINEFLHLKNELRNSVKKEYDNKLKVAFIFATYNSYLNDNDKSRIDTEAEKDTVFYFPQETIEYYEQLTNLLGKAAKYQLLGQIFGGKKIPNLNVNVSAVKGKSISGIDYYSFFISPENLIKTSYVLHRTETSPEATETYQRLINKSKIQNIGKFIDEGGYFANSIIVNIETNKIKFEQGNKIEGEGCDYGILFLPNKYKSVFIIDGQHRLFGYSHSKKSSSHKLPVMAFINLPVEEQTKLFVDINRTQKSVPANLLQSIMAEFNWKSENDKKALQALKTKLFVKLNSDPNSPFFKRIIVSQEKKTNKRCLTLKTLKDWGLNKVDMFGKIKGSHLIKTGYLSYKDHDKTLEKSFDFFKEIFNYLKEELHEKWEIGSGEGGLISMNIGVSTIIRLSENIIDYLVNNKRVEPENMNGKELAKLTFNFLDCIIEFVNNLDYVENKKLRGLFGAGAVDKLLRVFQELIHNDINDFSPEGLKQWIIENTGKFTKLAYDIGNDKLQPLIDSFIKKKLIEDYGKNNWWYQGVPEKVRIDCTNKKEKEKSTEGAWSYLDTIHYKEIIEYSWKSFGDIFTPPGFENASKKKRMKWLVDFNDIRKKYAHPQREKVTEDEYNELLEIYEWLSKTID